MWTLARKLTTTANNSKFRGASSPTEQLAQAQEELAYYKGLFEAHKSQVPIEWRLTKSEARIASCIIARGRPSLGALIEWVYLGRDEPDSAQNVVYALICRLRKKLERHGVELISHYGEGYSFRPSGQAKRTPALLSGQRESQGQ